MSDKSWEPEHFLTHSLSHSLTLSLSHSHTLTLSLTLSLSYSLTLDMLNKFCFHLYAQKSLFIAENCNGIFWDLLTLTCEFRSHRAGSQLKMSESQTKAGNHDFFFNLKF